MLLSCLMMMMSLVKGINPEMPLTLLTDSQGKKKGAVCLDGSNPGFYYRPANTTLDPSASTKWVLYFKGGGWCYTDAQCAARADNQLGNNSKFPKTFSFSGPMDASPTVNPDFAAFHHVILWYCDGASFSGNRDQPITVNYHGKNVTLYFRGRRVLDAILDTLMDKPYGLDKATEVLLAGGSAGGLSTFLHADYVYSKMPPTVTKFRAAPVSGFFLLHNTSSNIAEYPNRMKNVFNMQNSSGGVNQDCVNSLPHHEQWKCIFANYSYTFSKTPMFLLQSALDSWQMGNIWKGDDQCTKRQFSNCTKQQIKDLNGYEDDFLDDLKSTAKFNRPGEGGFVESCLQHCGAQGINFNTYTINGVTMQQALGKWWQSNEQPAIKNWYLPCHLNQEEPHQCNPSCGLKVGGCHPSDLLC